MSNSLMKFKTKALRRPGVKAAYVALEDEFQFLDEILKARLATGLTQVRGGRRMTSADR